MNSSNSESTQWPPANCPQLAWPALSSQHDRMNWYRNVISAYSSLWEDHINQAELAPTSEESICELEAWLGCQLPLPLRTYHLELGALSLAETLCSVTPGNTPIQPLLDAFPGITDICKNKNELMLAKVLIVFGDYLGNGNMFCFHRETGEVYYFDHDTGSFLTRFFSSTEEYLDALMIRCLTEIHDDEEAGEIVLANRFGDSIVKKWLY